MNWIREENYAERMKAEAEPYVAKRMTSGRFERAIGEPIYYEHFQADQPHAVIVISHGFTESIHKFTESIYYMLQAGYEVWGLDHRGHGRSFRENANPFVVHSERFENYVLDLKYLTEKAVKPAVGNLPVYLYCHSMGGCIGAWTIEAYPTLFQKAVLSSPMLGLSFGKIPVPVMYLGASLKGIGEKRKEPLSPVNAFPEAPDFENSCDSSECRYLYYHQKRLEDPGLQTTAPSIGWGKEAVKACARVCSKKHTARIEIPVLLFQAGNDTVVKNASQDLFASRVKNCRLECVPGMKHELYMTDSERLIPYWETVFDFFA
ncbi:MAG: alpha/beta hydrolase [Oscillospiraceae bacterium]|nr:alpha/beta hydrolase [Oscillospiraceae bacterium]